MVSEMVILCKACTMSLGHLHEQRNNSVLKVSCIKMETEEFV